MTQPFETLGVHEMRFRQNVDVVDPTIDIPDNSGVYGYLAKGYDRPELLAPIEEKAGGFLFLPGDVRPEIIENLVDLAGLGTNERNRCDRYALQVIDAPDGMEQQLGYMRKIVIADRFAMRFLFQSLSETEYNDFEPQELDVAELVQAFVEDERSKYGTMFGNPRLAGKFGGDGDWAQEALGFGFAIENEYHRVISVWSRGWLCTK